jgi:hypothetical protein
MSEQEIRLEMRMLAQRDHPPTTRPHLVGNMAITGRGQPLDRI